jgi:iron complex outermembrane recepter protein
LRVERGQPRTRINLGLDYDYDAYGLTLRGNRYGRVVDGGTEALNDVVLGPKWVVDLEARVKPIEKVELALGVNNLFDAYPDNIPRGQGVDPTTGAPRNLPVTRYAAPFSNFSPFGFNGRFLYARATVVF